MSTLRKRTAEWSTQNPVLANGQRGLDIETGKEKWGDGVTAWSGLSYMQSGGGGGGVTDHGDLTGLADDDHAHYYNQSRGDARYSLTGHDHSGTYAALGHNHDSAYAALSHGHAAGAITGLATVATSGAYADLSGAPTALTHAQAMARGLGA